MRSRIKRMVFVVVVGGLAGGCASGEDWKMWRSHTTHFASGDHASFSLRNNKEGSNPKVYRSDLEESRQQDWWGLYSVTANPSQIFQN